MCCSPWPHQISILEQPLIHRSDQRYDHCVTQYSLISSTDLDAQRIVGLPIKQFISPTQCHNDDLVCSRSRDRAVCCGHRPRGGSRRQAACNVRWTRPTSSRLHADRRSAALSLACTQLLRAPRGWMPSSAPSQHLLLQRRVHTLSNAMLLCMPRNCRFGKLAQHLCACFVCRSGCAARTALV